jgi:hypothetical protein
MATFPERSNAVMPCRISSSSHGKRGRDKATTGERQRAAKVPRSPGVEETKAQGEETPETWTTKVEEEEEETPDVPTTTNIVKLLSILWIEDDRKGCAIAQRIEEALTGLADLCCDKITDLSEVNERELRRLGGHMAVVQIVKKYVDDALIQEEGIRALLNCTNPTLAKVLVGDIGGVEVILAGMKRHPQAENVQRMGCGTIGNLCETKRNASRFEESDGIAQVIAAMKAHPENEDVQVYGCVALENMCEWAEYRPLIFAAGGAVTIATVMEKFSDNPSVRQSSQDAMQALVLERD